MIVHCIPGNLALFVKGDLMCAIDISFVSIPQGVVARTSSVGAEHPNKTKHFTQESPTMDSADQSSAYAEIAAEVHAVLCTVCMPNRQ